MAAVDYVAGKKNSLKAKRDKALWYEAKAQEYIAKANVLREETKVGEKLISDIEALQAQRQGLVDGIENYKRRIAQPVGVGGLTIEELFDKIKENEEEIVNIDVKIRSLYYGK